jgi:hypothetical protein
MQTLTPSAGHPTTNPNPGVQNEPSPIFGHSASAPPHLSVEIPPTPLIQASSKLPASFHKPSNPELPRMMIPHGSYPPSAAIPSRPRPRKSGAAPTQNPDSPRLCLAPLPVASSPWLATSPGYTTPCTPPRAAGHADGLTAPRAIWCAVTRPQSGFRAGDTLPIRSTIARKSPGSLRPLIFRPRFRHHRLSLAHYNG